MADPARLLSPTIVRATQVGAVILAVIVVVVFLLSQTQTASIEYGTQPLSSRADRDDGDDGGSAAPGRGSGTLPPDAEVRRLMAQSRIVRLPGAIAEFDVEAVNAAIDRTETVLRQEDPEDFTPIKVVLSPPGLSEADTQRFYDLAGDHIRVEGLQVSYVYTATPSEAAGWESTFAVGDVTSQMLTLLALAADEPEPPDSPSTVDWRAPTDAELRPVLDGLAGDRWHAFPGADLDGIPAAAAEAFPDSEPLIVALPRQRYGTPVPDYAAALAQRFPDTPIMVMYGYWIDFAGPLDADSVELATAGFYGPNDSVLADRVFPQRNVLGRYLDRWTAMRYAGVFERPLPFVPADPLAVAKPALPWVFAGSVLLFVAGSVISVRRRLDGGTSAGDPSAGVAAEVTTADLWTRVTTLSGLAIEASALADGPAKDSLTRGIRRLEAATEGLEQQVPLPLVASQVTAAEREFAAMADAMGRPDYDPDAYAGTGAIP